MLGLQYKYSFWSMKLLSINSHLFLKSYKTCIAVAITAVHIGCNTQDCSGAFSGADLHCCPHWLQHSRLQLCFLRGRPALLSTLAATPSRKQDLQWCFIRGRPGLCPQLHIGSNSTSRKSFFSLETCKKCRCFPVGHSHIMLPSISQCQFESLSSIAAL